MNVGAHRHDSDRATGPVHPHPLSNDLTDDPLAPRKSTERRSKRLLGIYGRAIRVDLAIVLFIGTIAVAIAALLAATDRMPFAGLAALVVLYMLLLATPVVLAAWTKEAQDEAVRDGAAKRWRTRSWRR